MDDKDKFIQLASDFIDDVLPQIGKLCLQDYSALNEMLMLQRKLQQEQKKS